MKKIHDVKVHPIKECEAELEKLKSDIKKVKGDNKNLQERFQEVVQLKTKMNDTLKSTKAELEESRKINEKLASTLADKFIEQKSKFK